MVVVSNKELKLIHKIAPNQISHDHGFFNHDQLVTWFYVIALDGAKIDDLACGGLGMREIEI